jgi:hypothetical protein
MGWAVLVCAHVLCLSHPTLPRTSSPWSVTPSEYEYSMSITNVVINGSTPVSTGRVAAVIGGEVRGVIDIETADASRVFVGEYAGALPFFLMVYSNARGESVNFLYEDDAGTTTSLTEWVVFESDGHLGNLDDPFVLTGGGGAV